MNISYDWEFWDNGIKIVPISLGMVNWKRKSELYIINSSFPEDGWTDWLKKNVRPKLKSVQPVNANILEIAEPFIGDTIYQWLQSFDDNSEWRFLGNYADYDHVCLAQRFGPMINLPRSMPWFTYDLHQWVRDVGNPRIPIEEECEHNALADARRNVAIMEWLKANYEHPGWGNF